MVELGITLPESRVDDDEDVVWQLSTAAALWARGERFDAIVWLRRAARRAADSSPGRGRELEGRADALELSMNHTVTIRPPPPPPAEPIARFTDSFIAIVASAPKDTDAPSTAKAPLLREATPPPRPPAPHRADIASPPPHGPTPIPRARAASLSTAPPRNGAPRSLSSHPPRPLTLGPMLDPWIEERPAAAAADPDATVTVEPPRPYNAVRNSDDPDDVVTSAVPLEAVLLRKRPFTPTQRASDIPLALGAEVGDGKAPPKSRPPPRPRGADEGAGMVVPRQPLIPRGLGPPIAARTSFEMAPFTEGPMTRSPVPPTKRLPGREGPSRIDVSVGVEAPDAPSASTWPLAEGEKPKDVGATALVELDELDPPDSERP